MADRMISDRIKSSKALANLSDFSFRLWVHVMTETDGLGRFEADPAWVNSRAIPYLQRTDGEVREAMAEWSKVDLARFYRADDREYGYFPKFDLYQKLRHKTPKFPAVPGSAAERSEPPRTSAEVEVEVEVEVEPTTPSEQPSSQQELPKTKPKPTGEDWGAAEKLRKLVMGASPSDPISQDKTWKRMRWQWANSFRIARENNGHDLGHLLDLADWGLEHGGFTITTASELILKHRKILLRQEQQHKFNQPRRTEYEERVASLPFARPGEDLPQ